MKKTREIIGGLGNLMFKEAYILSQMWKGWIPDQYVQSESYWAEHKDRIKAHFGTDIPEKTDRVAIHVRRGDYVNNPFYIQLWETYYYEKATALFPKEKFLVFSDDIPYCKKIFGDMDCEFSEGLSEVDDLNKMASCKSIIIANSSYSWWAAYISPYAEKIVAPKQWFTDGITRIDLPETWIKI